MSDILVIGIGNEFRSDDSAGILIAQRLKKDFPQLQILEISDEQLQILNYFGIYKTVIIIDSILSDNSRAGEVEKIIISKERTFPSQKFYSSHSISLNEAIEFAKELNQLPDNLIILGIHSSNFQIGTYTSFDIDIVYSIIKKEINKLLL